ncbi:unnamed protein product [Rotaria sordida]|uniref:Uncharacterized protein n=2 Tax=Rotaria sordida TaxID=392033 RepID=A0A816DEX1_9BILA|nr:unnamed protein product [Rotaria sordida]CAF1636442.1 unnamed protein product [Rotaria sordida]
MMMIVFAEEELLSIIRYKNKISAKESVPNGKSITTDDDDSNTNSNSFEYPDENLKDEITVRERATIDLLPRVTPNSTSSISVRHNENSNINNDTISTENHLNAQNTAEMIDENDQVEKIESVRKNQCRI